MAGHLKLTCVAAPAAGSLTRYREAAHPSAGRSIWSGTKSADVPPGCMDGDAHSGLQAALPALRAVANGRGA